MTAQCKNIVQRKPFNWSLLDRAVLYNMFDQAGSTIVGHRLPVDVLHKKLSTHIKSCLPVSVKKKNRLNNESGYVYVGGEYDSDFDQNQKLQIAVILLYRKSDTHLLLTKVKWDHLCTLFSDAILHEIVHMRQYRCRKFESIDGYDSVLSSGSQYTAQTYYGHPDEMRAFSFNIACDIISEFGSDKSAINEYLDDQFGPRHVIGPPTTYSEYLYTFDWNHSHPVIQQLKKLIRSQLPNALLGKPFKSANYLTY